MCHLFKTCIQIGAGLEKKGMSIQNFDVQKSIPDRTTIGRHVKLEYDNDLMPE